MCVCGGGGGLKFVGKIERQRDKGVVCMMEIAIGVSC